MRIHQFARTARRRSSASIIALSLSLLAACTSVSVDRQVGAMERLPPPDRVLVYNFAVTPQEVQLDAVGSAITSTLDGTADSQQEIQIGQAVANALAKRLVSDIQNMGLWTQSERQGRCRRPGPISLSSVSLFRSTRATKQSA